MTLLEPHDFIYLSQEILRLNGKINAPMTFKQSDNKQPKH